MKKRVAPSAALEAAIEELLSEGLGDSEQLAEVGRLGARLVLQRALEEEVAEFLGRARYERTAEARDKLLWGLSRRRVMDDAEKRLIAWHEAGHAVLQAVLDDGTVPVHKVTIIPRGQSLGSTTCLPTKEILTRPKKKLLNEVAMAMLPSAVQLYWRRAVARR